MAKLSGMRCLVRSLAVGVSIMSETESAWVSEEEKNILCIFLDIRCSVQFVSLKIQTRKTMVFSQLLIVDKLVEPFRRLQPQITVGDVLRKQLSR